jgi:hypothetical protein
MVDVSDSTKKLTVAQWEDMEKRIGRYVLLNDGKLPTEKIFLTPGSQDWITFAQGVKIAKRVMQWIKDNPSKTLEYVYINKPTATPSPTTPPVTPPVTPPAPPVRTINAVHQQLESALGGQFNNITEAYNLVKNNTYMHYMNPQYDYKSELERINNHSGLNCADWSQIFMKVMGALNQEGHNYEANIVHVWCRHSNGVASSDIGHYFGQARHEDAGEDWTDYDFAEAACCGTPPDTVMCSYGYAIVGYNDIPLE